MSKARAGTSKRVLSQAMAKQMLTKQSEGFGLGFELHDGSDRFSHGGWNDGFQATLIAFADSGSGVAIMANSDNGALLFERLAASIAAEYGWKSFTHRLESPLMTVDLLARLKGAEALLAWYKAMRSDGQRLPPPLLNKVGYGLLLAGRHTDAVKVLEAQVELYPEDAEAYDSLGEGYLKAGRNEEAIASYKKALKLDPENSNAVKMLEKLGARP